MRTIRWGIIGCGDVTEVKSGPAFYKTPGSALVAVMRRDSAKAKDFAARHNVARWYDDGAKLIADPDVDAVYVATPPSSHEQYAVMAANSGKPVYVEKPMARTHAECLRMIEATRSAGTPLFVAYYRRRLPSFLRVKQLLDDGAIGDVRLVNVTLALPPRASDLDRSTLHWHVDTQISGGGRFVDQACHMLDLVDFFCGPLQDVHGNAANQAGLYDPEDIVTAQWRHASGALGVGSWCFTAGQPEDRIELVGSRGTITVPCFAVAPTKLRTPDGVQEFSEPPPVHIQQPMIQAVVEALNGRGENPCPGDVGARTSWVMDQVLEAWRANGRSEYMGG